MKIVESGLAFAALALLGAVVASPAAAQSLAAPGGGDQEGRVVGTCDSSSGCHSLQLACRDLPGHTYTPPGPGGVPKGKCTKDGAGATADRGVTASPRNGAASGEGRLASRRGGGLEDAVCTTTALCNRLRIRCQGTFERYAPNHGRCKDN